MYICGKLYHQYVLLVFGPSILHVKMKLIFKILFS